MFESKTKARKNRLRIKYLQMKEGETLDPERGPEAVLHLEAPKPVIVNNSTRRSAINWSEYDRDAWNLIPRQDPSVPDDLSIPFDD
jgi:hypothetical protein